MRFSLSHAVRKNAGFTLIELLVVIAIIAVLSTIGLSAFTSAQQRARDARRRGDIKAVQDSFEQYYAGVGANSYATGGGACDTMASSLQTGRMPVDPKNSGIYTYTCTPTSATQYCVCAAMEVLGQGNSTNATCNFTTPGAAAQGYQCVRNLQ